MPCKSAWLMGLKPPFAKYIRQHRTGKGHDFGERAEFEEIATESVQKPGAQQNF